MSLFKYYEKIEAAQAETGNAGRNTRIPFNIHDLGPNTLRDRVISWLVRNVAPLVLAFLRAVWPNARFGKFIIVTRHADVAEVLANSAAFEVPFGREMRELGGADFVLGLEDEAHARQNALIRSVMRREDGALIEAQSKYVAERLLHASGGHIDVMRDLITRVATEVCAKYFGLSVGDPDQFADWSFSISALLFGDPGGSTATRNLALAGAERVRAVAHQAIRDARDRRDDPGDVGSVGSDTLVDRLVAAQATDSSIGDDEIVAILVGLVTGMIPTNTLAAGKIMQELLARPRVMYDAAQLAKADDFDGLQEIVLECARLNPALAPGQWRYARKEGVIAKGTLRSCKVPKDAVLLVSTQAALRDRRRYPAPGKFKADRDREPNLLFGAYEHECLGRYVATHQITAIFQALLKQDGLARDAGADGRLVWLGPFPRRLDMTFKPTGSVRQQSMVIISAPVAVDRVAALQQKIAALGNPASAAIDATLRKTGIVHFSSMTLIEGGDADTPLPKLLFELNLDGDRDEALEIVAEAAEAWLGPIFAEVTGAANRPLVALLREHALDLKPRPWGATGINYSGLLEFGVENTEMQAALAAFSKKATQVFLKDHIGLGSRAMNALNFVRNLINQDPALVAMANNADIDATFRGTLKGLLAEGESFKDHLLWPSRRRLLISEWIKPTGNEGIFRFLSSAAVRPVYWGAALAVLLGTIIHGWIALPDPANWFTVASQIVFSLGISVVAFLIVAGGVVLMATLLLRYHEKNDVPEDLDPPVDLINKIAASENHLGYAQNHLTAVTPLKPGWFRKLTLAVALWGIVQLIVNLFRPGFVVGMGTIHYARWVRLPGTDKLVFTTNYDGSWESYLEDFITKAHNGQTMAWSNCIGFPRTRFLFLDGASDGDLFKRWVRRQQVVTGFWYSHFPKLTTDHIRNNALIHDGLMRAHDDTAARAWMDCFGTTTRWDYTVEAEEVQSMVFRSSGKLEYGTCALLRLPDDSKLTQAWLEQLVNAEGPGDFGRITFGDQPSEDPDKGDTQACHVAFSAAGLNKLGLPQHAITPGDNVEPEARLSSFPTVFNIGMANRGRILGDHGDDAPGAWRWTDDSVDIALFIQAKDATLCKNIVAAHVAALGGNCLISEVVTQPVLTDDDKKLGKGVGHFGFRDGISQPVIHGTRRYNKGVEPRDVVAPGELLLGYRNTQNFFPTSIAVRPELDQNQRLPLAAGPSEERFPRFRRREAKPDVRDFGRNGTFVAIRQLPQDVDGFNTFIGMKADELNEMSNLRAVVGGPVTPEWVAAKMMGRWQDGTSLLERTAALPPVAAKPVEDDENDKNKGGAKPEKKLDNSFNFGDDDPQGLACPFGAHIRRTNPRQSLHPSDPTQLEIINRHRILRRGRPYHHPAKGDNPVEKGLLFVALCADLERQFEFVQQTWVASPNFHRLQDEPDPIVATDQPDQPRAFTIPTTAGSVTLDNMQGYVGVRGGGYFFLPGRASLLFLIDLLRG